MKRHLLFLLCTVAGFACKETPPGPTLVPTIQLAFEDASCTEAWLKVTTTEIPTTVRLLRDGERVSEVRLLTSDSLILNEGLLPRHNYAYQLQKLANDSTIIEASPSVQVTTMDTTSHACSFSMDTLGVNLSILHDIAFINDTLAYAVGEISVLDSIGQLVNPPYNIARWNGRKWEFMRRLWDCRLYYPNCGPSEFFLFNPIRSIAAFSPNDIWIAAGTAQHFDGTRWTEYPGVQGVGTAYKIWGDNPNNLFFVGYGGFIARYTGTTWQRVESGVTITLNDVWGGSNRWLENNIVLIAASEKYTFSEKRILRIKAPAVLDTLSWPMQDRPIQSLWFDTRSNLYACGSGVFVLKNATWKRFTSLPSIYTNCIRGNAENDIWVVGDFGTVSHFNGMSWYTYPSMTFSGILHSVAVKGKRLIAVGEISSGQGTRAVVVRGQRN